MLERSSLLLLKWSGGRDEPRRIIDPSSGAATGCARWRSAAPLLARLLAPPVLEVREAGDDPLLCTLLRLGNWGVVWQVRAADGHRVALIARREIRNRADRRLALLRERPERDELEMQGQDGRPLAVLRRGAEGDWLTYAAEVEGNPFVKMALLAAALTRDL